MNKSLKIHLILASRLSYYSSFNLPRSFSRQPQRLTRHCAACKTPQIHTAAKAETEVIEKAGFRHGGPYLVYLVNSHGQSKGEIQDLKGGFLDRLGPEDLVHTARRDR